MPTPEERIERLTRRLVRERRARKEAEQLMQDRSRELAELRAAAGSFAVTDPLTQLGNSIAFRAKFEELIATETGFVLLLVELAHVDDITHVHGHAAGDAALRWTALQLDRACPDATFIGRIADCQFAVLMPAERALGSTDSIAAEIARPLIYTGRRIDPGVAIGIARFPEHGSTAKDLQRNATIALDRAKAGPVSCVLFEEEMGRDQALRQALTADLAHALFDGQIEPWFQPIVEPATKRVLGAEILARWRHPTRGLLSPAVFLPLLEERHLMDDLFAHLLRTTAPLIKRWIAACAMRYVTINVSPSQFRSGQFVADVRDLLYDLDFPAGALTIEVTEEIITHDFAAVRDQLALLSAQGIRLALDDFGVGYANVSILRHLSFDVLKVDRSLTAGVATEARVASVLHAIVGLAEALHMSPVAEGIEDESQSAALADLGFGTQQGYFFGRPMPAPDFERHLSLNQPVA